MAEIFFHAFKHSVLDALKLIPFLFATYLIMELLEHRAEEKTEVLISRSGRIGPLFGGLLGALPQCGFSASGASLYSGRVITLGTLFAIFLSTSDEMLPVMIAGGERLGAMLTVLIAKVILGIIIGFAVDLIVNRHENISIGHFCEEEGCHCEKEGVFRSAIHHTLSVSLFIFLVGFVLEMAIGFIGEDRISDFMAGTPVTSQLIAATLALIPNCAPSVIVTELYLEGVISAGAMMSGLLTGAGIGTLVLFRTNRSVKENLAILASLWGIGVIVGILLDILNFGALLK